MEKIKFKKVFSKTFVAAIAAGAMIGAVNVNAENIRETVNNEITDGSYIIGITRFSNDVVITADRVLMASQDDIFFKGIVGYQKPAVYQYQLGQWIKYDANNNPSVASDAEVARLNAQDIYYVNNVEKVLEIAYTRENAGNNLTFTTDAVGKTIKYENGIMYVPATTKTIEVKSGNTLLETLKKTNVTEDGEFSYVSGESNYYGSIAADDMFTKSTDTVVNGETITVNGIINWSGSTNTGIGLEGIKDGKAGHRIGVQITAPNGTNLTDTTGISIKVNGKTVAGGWNAAQTGKNSSFWFTPLVEAGKSYTVKVVWGKDSDNNEISQTFTINVNGTLAPKPAGTLAGETIYAKDDKGEPTSEVLLSASSSSETLLTFAGKEIAWDGAVKLNIGVNSYYTNNSSFSGPVSVTAYYPGTKIDALGYEVADNTPIAVNASYDAATKTLGISGINFNDTTKGHKVTVEVKWDNDYTQTFDVVLDSNVKFVAPDVRLENVQTIIGFGEDDSVIPANHKVENDTVTISNTQILWKNGNNVSFTVVPSTSANNSGKDEYKGATVYSDEELARLTVKVNGVLQVDENDKDENGNPKPITLASNLPVDMLVDNGNGSYTVEIIWDGAKVVKTFTIKLENVTLAPAQQGTYSVDGQIFNATYTDGIINVYRPTSHNLTETDADGKEQIVGQENDFLPFIYELNSNAAYINFNNTKPAQRVEVDGKEIKKTTRFLGTVSSSATSTTENNKEISGYAIPVKAGVVTVVKVYWDDVNVQEFKVTPNTAFAKYEKAASGVAYVGTKKQDVEYSTTLKYNGEVRWTDTTDEIVIESEKTPADSAYVLEGLTFEAPAALGTVDASKVKITINGGKYSSTETATNYAKVDAAKAVKNNTVVLNPVITSANDSFTVTIDWNGAFVETYKVNLDNATLKTGEGTLSLADGKTIDNYNGPVPYVEAEGGNALSVTLSEVPTKVELVDAIPNKDKDGNVIDGPREATVTDKKVNVVFTNEKRTATMIVTWANGFKKEYTINATNATIPTIVMESGLTASDEKGIDYVVTAKVDANLGAIVSRVLPNTAELVSTSSITDADAVHPVVKENGVYKAKAVGTETITFSVTDAKPVVVKFVITNDAIAAQSTASFDGDKLKVVSNVSGGTSKNYIVDVKLYAFDEETGLYGTEVVGEATGVKNANGAFETNVVSKTSDPLPKEVKVVITTIDESLKNADLENLTDDQKNLVVTEVIELPKEVRYTLTFDANGGTPVDSVTVEAGAKVDAPTTKKNDELTPNGKFTKKYEFKAWYTVESFKEDGTLADKTEEFDGSSVSADKAYRAYYEVKYFNEAGKEVDPETGEELNA